MPNSGASRSIRRSAQTSALLPNAATALAAGAIAALTLVVYLLTLAPELYSLDSPELATAAYRLGIAHPPGYPFYTLAGWAFSHAFPVSNVAFRLNLLSAIFAVAACLAVFALSLRMRARTTAAAAGALALAFSYYFWADALAAEVYTLDAALFAGMLLAAVWWRADQTPLRAAAVALLLGLSLATRTTSLLYAPAVVVFAAMSGARPGRWLLAPALALVAGLAFYAYLPLRSAAGVDVGPGDYALDGTLQVWNLATWGGFWSHVSASAFQRDAFAYGPVALAGQAGTFAAQLTGSFMVIGVPFGIAGAVRQWRQDRALFVLLFGTAAPVTLFFIDYGTVDKEFMFLPAYVVFAAWVALGLEWALEWGSGPDVARGAAWALAAAPLLLPLAALGVNWSLVSLSGERRPRTEAVRFLTALPPGAVVYGSFLEVAPLTYLQEVEGMRTDVKAVNAWTADDGFLSALADANVGTRPFFVMGDEPQLRQRYQLVPLARGGAGYEVRPRGG
ncbi:MAG: DUF2723 domain-containing protein [Chloroflexi bacterium]|nr:DUF2723 domain-containing protein [Chloroflexota bacterium]